MRRVYYLLAIFAVLLFPGNVQAAALNVGDTFTAGDVTYTVTSVSPKEVQVGNTVQMRPAISQNYSGKLTIPSSVTGSDGNEYSVTEIGGWSFSRCENLSEVVIPETVGFIGSYSFSDSGITTVFIPKSVTYIAGNPFQGCEQLGQIVVEEGNPKYDSRDNCNAILGGRGSGLIAGCYNTVIPSSVEIIESAAFWGCKKLKSIQIPSSVSYIGIQAFFACTGLESLYIPSTLTDISPSAFQSCGGLNSIVVESGNSVYDSREDCNALIETSTNTLMRGCRNTIIPNSVTTISEEAFLLCSGLTSIDIPNSVTSIGSEAFSNCQELESVHIPSSVSNIGYQAFWDCNNLQTVISDIEDPFAVEDLTFTTEIFPSDVLTYVVLSVPEGTKEKYLATGGWNKFGVIEERVAAKPLSVGETFQANGITYMVTNTNPLEVQVGSQYGAAIDENWAEPVEIPATVEGPDGNMYAVTTLGDYAFYNCWRVRELILPFDNPPIIPEQAFVSWQFELVLLRVPQGSVDRYKAANVWNQFGGIVEIGKSIMKEGETFEYDGITYEVNEFPYFTVNVGKWWEPACDVNREGDVTIPTTVIGKDGMEYTPVSIAGQAFLECDKITSITIPESIESINNQAFNSTAISSIIIPSSVTFIGTSVLAGCRNLTSIVVSPNNTTYDSRDNCNAIIKSDTNELIEGCNATVIPSTVTTIGQSAFSGRNLTSIEISNSITVIGERAFSGCRSATSIILGAAVESIGELAFQGCVNVTEITSYIENPPAIPESAFPSGLFENVTLTIPYGSKDKYEQANGWKNFKNIEVIGGPAEPEYYAVYNDGTLTFYYDTNLRSRTGTVYTSKEWRIKLDDGWGEHASEITKVVFDASFADYTEVGGTDYMFYGCSSLTSIVGLENLKTDMLLSMNGMFYGCTSLTTLDLSCLNTSYVREMGQIFCDCSSLTNINLGGNFSTASATDLSFMFSGCSSLTNLDLSSFDTKNVTNMNGMFFNCSSLKSVNLSSFSTSKVTSLYNMFSGCSSLTDIDLTNFDTSNVKNMSGMFQDCSGLKSLDISGFNTSSVTDFTQMFMRCSSLTSLDLSSFNTSKVTSTMFMFRECLSLTTISVGDQWNTDNISHSTSMFDACNSLVGGRGTKFDANHINASYAHIDGGTENPGYLTDINAPQDNVVLTVNSYTREYGEENPAFEYTETEGTITSGTPAITCEATKTSPVGTYAIVIAQGTVSNSSVELVKGTLTITKAPLTIAAKSYSRKQGEENPKLEVEYKGFKNNETEEILSKKPSVETRATATSEPGKYEITVSGAEAENYEITYKNGELTVTKADAIIVTAKSYTREYGEANPNFEFTSDGAALDGTPEITCEATATSPVGTYPIVIKKGSVKNYNDEYVNGILTITKAPLKVSVKDYTITEGEELPEFELTFEGFKNNETKDVLTKLPVATTEATSSSKPGTYAIKISGGEAENYDFSYTEGAITILEAPKPDPIETESGETVQKLDDGTVAVTGNKNATDDYQIPETVVIEGVSYQVTKIEPEAFKNNTELTKVTIPATVLEIGEGAFAGCTNLTEIVIYTVTPPTTLSEVRTRATGTSIFEGVDKETCLLYVPDGSVDAYKAADGWKEFKHILPISTLGISSFSADGRSFEVYNLQGRKVRHEATSLDGLPKGVYIINGKKIVK